MPDTCAPTVDCVLNAVIDAVITIDDKGRIRSVNPATENIFGYPRRSLIGKNVSLLMPGPFGREHGRHLERYKRTHKAHVIGTGREVVAKKKDGTVFPAHLSVSECCAAGGGRFFTGVLRDITEIKQAHEVLKKQNEFTAAVLNTVRSLVLVLDLSGRIVSFNRACEEATGYSFGEVAGKPFWDIFATDVERKAVMKNFLRTDPKKLANNFETVWLNKKGERRLILWSNSLIFDGENEPEYVIGTGTDITERRRLERMVLEITKKEQRRLGQELHDGIAQDLGLTAVVAKILEQKLTRASSPFARDLKRVVGMINQAVSKTRELAQGFYALEMRSEGLVLSLKKLVRETEKQVGVRCVVRTDPRVRVPADDRAAHLYRIAREAVGNAVEHGQGKRIQVHLKRHGAHRSELRVENDGKHFSPRVRRKGLGLPAMYSRAAILGASLEIKPGPRGGTVVSCVFPVP